MRNICATRAKEKLYPSCRLPRINKLISVYVNQRMPKIAQLHPVIAVFGLKMKVLGDIQGTENPCVRSSILRGGTTIFNKLLHKKGLQLQTFSNSIINIISL